MDIKLGKIELVNDDELMGYTDQDDEPCELVDDVNVSAYTEYTLIDGKWFIDDSGSVRSIYEFRDYQYRITYGDVE